MGLLRLLSGVAVAVGLLIKGAVMVVVTIAAWLAVQNMVQSGQLPPDPLGLAAMGLPQQFFGIPTTYAGAILLFDGLVLFGDGGSGSGTGGGFGGGGGGGGGGGDGGGGSGP